jgi:hypothetical protein
MTNFADQVAAGVAFLDATAPEWRAGITSEKLSMSDPFRCILGLTFGEFWSAASWGSRKPREDFDGISQWAADRGFTVFALAIDYDCDDDSGWDDLDAEWRNVLGLDAPDPVEFGALDDPDD